MTRGWAFDVLDGSSWLPVFKKNIWHRLKRAGRAYRAGLHIGVGLHKMVWPPRWPEPRHSWPNPHPGTSTTIMVRRMTCMVGSLLDFWEIKHVSPNTCFCLTPRPDSACDICVFFLRDTWQDFWGIHPSDITQQLNLWPDGWPDGQTISDPSPSQTKAEPFWSWLPDAWMAFQPAHINEQFSSAASLTLYWIFRDTY